MTRWRLRLALILFACNAYVSLRVFGLEYSHRMDSIEGAYIGISRHILASFPDLSWWPAWYGGIPFQNSYPPLLHYLVALYAAVTSASVPHAHHIITALFYCLGPVFAFLMMDRLSGRVFPSFCAALLYTAVSPAALLVRKIAGDMGHPLRPRRLGTLIAYGDGPHLAALALIPLAVYALDCALARRTPLRLALAALAMAAVACTNWLGAFGLAALLLCYLVAGRPWRDWVTTGLIGVAAYVLVSPLMPPSLIRTIQFNAQTIGGDWSGTGRAVMHYGPFALAGLAMAAFLMRRFGVPTYLQMLVLFTGFIGWIGLSYEWAGIAVVPQPDRYMLEFDLGFCLAVAMAAALLPLRVARLLAIGLLLFSVAQLYRGNRYGRGLIKPVDVATTVEYRVADWCDRNLHGARVMVPGTIQFFWSAFTETPEMGGGFENGVVNYVDRIAQYQVLSGDGLTVLNDVPVAVLWLKAFGVQAVAAGGKASREYYHPFLNGAKFAGVLPELYRDGDDAVYAVPLRSASLAHVMGRDKLVVHRPVNGIDLVELRRYVEALDDPALPEAQFVWRTQHSAEVLADLAPGQVAQVQVTYHPGWHATVNGVAAAIVPDGLGFFAVAPDCTGRCRMELVYDGGREQQIARAASLVLVLCWLAWASVSMRRHRVRSTGFSTTA